ncbi:MAG: ATP-binding cassette domain-containing protein, partial [Blastocatellia bacterium]|nr:ATP-binding cassette domain-containing protein [Blastocatellia bacterium]
MLQVSIRKRYGNNGREVRNERNFTLDLDFAAPGGVTILFGPSGSGKTSCLRAVAGIIRPDEGRIAVGERIYFDSAVGANLTIQERRVGFVFQDYLLFPHLTAEQNIAYGVRSRGGTHKMSKTEKRARARELLALLGIEYAAQQYPGELSGGESQRVALARALASDPEMVLLDEPLSAVDALTRARLLAEIG